MEDEREKPEKIKQERGLGLFCSLSSSDGGLYKLITFLY